MVLFGNLSVCKSTIWRKLKTSLKKTNETAAHERPQSRAQSMKNCGGERVGILEKERDLERGRKII